MLQVLRHCSRSRSANQKKKDKARYKKKREEKRHAIADYIRCDSAFASETCVHTVVKRYLRGK